MNELTIGVISVCRDRKSAYVYITQKSPYWSTNTELNLEFIEKEFGCVFVDGYLPNYVTITLYEKDGWNLESILDHILKFPAR